VAPTLQVKILTASVMTSTPDPYVGEEWLTWIRVCVCVGGGGGRRLDPKAVRILPEVVATTWEVH
jgi:hypothetical protein